MTILDDIKRDFEITAARVRQDAENAAGEISGIVAHHAPALEQLIQMAINAEQDPLVQAALAIALPAPVRALIATFLRDLDALITGTVPAAEPQPAAPAVDPEQQEAS